MTYVGIEIGGSKLPIVVGDASGQIRERRRLSVDPRQDATGIRQQIAAILQQLLEAHHPAAIGVGFGGPVDWQTGQVARSHQIEGWSEFDLREWLGSISGLPVFVDNDANLGALGEARHGAGAGFNPVFYVTLGSGVGGGLVVNGGVYHGAKPGESEIGHVRLDRQGTNLESRCSGWAVDQKIRQFKRSHPQGLLAQLASEATQGEARFLRAALEQDDLAAKHILTETAEDLAFGLSHVVHLIHPTVIVLGGGLSLVGEPLRAAVEQALPKFIMEVFLPGPAVRLAALGEDTVPVGALTLAALSTESVKGEAKG